MGAIFANAKDLPKPPATSLDGAHCSFHQPRPFWVKRGQFLCASPSVDESLILLCKWNVIISLSFLARCCHLTLYDRRERKHSCWKFCCSAGTYLIYFCLFSTIKGLMITHGSCFMIQKWMLQQPFWPHSRQLASAMALSGCCGL